MIIPVVIIPWRAVRFFLIAMAIVFGLLGGLFVLQAYFFEPVPNETAIPTPGVKVRR
jgi:hypothetical protein